MPTARFHRSTLALTLRPRTLAARAWALAPQALVLLSASAIALDFGHLLRARRSDAPRGPIAAESGAAAAAPGTPLKTVRALFGDAAPAAVAATAPGPLVLHGTIAVAAPERGLAIIGASGAAGLYAVGAEVGGARLQAVYADHVVLARDGSTEALYLPRPDLGFVIAGNGPRVERPVPPDDDSTTAPAPHEVHRRVAVATAPLAALLKARPLMNDGRYRALVVEPSDDPAAFARLGLMPRDSIMAVNGKIVTPESLDLLAREIRSGRPVHVYVNRAGEGPMDVALNTAGVELPGDR